MIVEVELSVFLGKLIRVVIENVIKFLVIILVFILVMNIWVNNWLLVNNIDLIFVGILIFMIF